MGSTTAEKTCVTAPPDRGCVEIRGARQNNLKGIDFDLPLGKLTAITGPGGHGDLFFRSQCPCSNEQHSPSEQHSTSKSLVISIDAVAAVEDILRDAKAASR